MTAGGEPPGNKKVGDMKIKYEEMDIDEAKAKFMLSASRGNPRYNKQNAVNRATVAKYANDMKNGRWQFSPEPISFNENGELVDGHHRLNAVIQSKTTVKFIVARNVPNETKIFDRGLRRTTSQLIKFSENMDNILGTGQVLSAVKLWFAYARTEGSKTPRPLRAEAEKVTDSEIVDLISSNYEDLIFCANVTKGSKKPYLMENSACIYSMFCALKSGVNKDIISEFCKVIKTGLYNGNEQSAAIIARNYLLEHKAHDFDTAIKRTEYIQTCLLDFSRGVARERKYYKTAAVFTEKVLSMK
jgi:hypothetical protein